MPPLRLQDMADIAIITFLLYQLYRWFRNTKALQVLIGLGLLGVVYFVTRNLGLLMTSWILQELGTVLVILIIVIFQNEIRQALYRFSLLRNIFETPAPVQAMDYTEVSEALFGLAAGRTGAIVAFRRNEPLEEHLLNCVSLDSLPSAQLLMSIFHPKSPLHDGAVIVGDGRIVHASCHLPLSSNTRLPQAFGTRHRAAVGLTEVSDAVVVTVSEERGAVSIATAGEVRQVKNAAELAAMLQKLLTPPVTGRQRPRVREWLLRDFRPKLVIFALVVASWFIVTGKGGEIVSLTVPLRFHGLSQDLVLMRSYPDEVELQLKVFSGFISSPRSADIVADIDLSSIRAGSNTVNLHERDLRLPLGVVLSSIEPQRIKVVAERKVRKDLRVVVRSVQGFRRKVIAAPATVTVEGPADLLARLETIATEDVDGAALDAGDSVEARLLLPAPSVKLVTAEAVTIRPVSASRGRKGLKP